MLLLKNKIRIFQKAYKKTRKKQECNKGQEEFHRATRQLEGFQLSCPLYEIHSGEIHCNTQWHPMYRTIFKVILQWHTAGRTDRTKIQNYENVAAQSWLSVMSRWESVKMVRFWDHRPEVLWRRRWDIFSISTSSINTKCFHTSV